MSISYVQGVNLEHFDAIILNETQARLRDVNILTFEYYDIRNICPLLFYFPTCVTNLIYALTRDSELKFSEFHVHSDTSCRAKLSEKE